MKDSYIKIYEVYNQNLTKASKLMNCDCDTFRSSIIDILVGDKRTLLFVEMQGSYPFITNEWEGVII